MSFTPEEIEEAVEKLRGHKQPDAGIVLVAYNDGQHAHYARLIELGKLPPLRLIMAERIPVMPQEPINVAFTLDEFEIYDDAIARLVKLAAEAKRDAEYYPMPHIRFRRKTKRRPARAAVKVRRRHQRQARKKNR